MVRRKHHCRSASAAGITVTRHYTATKLTSENVLSKMKRETLILRAHIVSQKMVYAGHFLKGSRGTNANSKEKSRRKA